MNVDTFAFYNVLLRKYPIAVKGYTRYYYLLSRGTKPLIVSYETKNPCKIKINVNDIPDLKKEGQLVRLIQESGRHFNDIYRKRKIKRKKSLETRGDINTFLKKYQEKPIQSGFTFSSALDSNTVKWIQPLLSYLGTMMEYFLVAEVWKIDPNVILLEEIEEKHYQERIDQFEKGNQELIDKNEPIKHLFLLTVEDVDFSVADDVKNRIFYEGQARDYLELYLTFMRNAVADFIETAKKEGTQITESNRYTESFLKFINFSDVIDKNIPLETIDLFKTVLVYFNRSRYVKHIYNSMLTAFLDPEFQSVIQFEGEFREIISNKMSNLFNFFMMSSEGNPRFRLNDDVITFLKFKPHVLREEFLKYKNEMLEVSKGIETEKETRKAIEQMESFLFKSNIN